MKINKITLISTKSPINYPPMGLLYIANALKKKEIEFNLGTSDISINKLEELIKNSDSIGMSVITSPEINNIVKLSKYIKRKFPTKRIIWGGPHTTLNSKEVLGEDYVDSIITKHAERKIMKIKNKTKYHLDNFSPEWDILDNLSQFVYPEEHSNHSKSSGDKRNIFYYLSTSRGCPYKCGFCSISSLTNNKWEAHSSEFVENQLDYITERLKKEGIKIGGVGIWDDMFWMDNNRSDKILSILKNRNLRYYIESRADKLLKNNSLLLKKLKETGCLQVFVGAESANQETLNMINKNTSPEQYRKLMIKSKEIGLPIRYSLIVGFPNETDQSVNDTLDFVKEIGTNELCSVSGPKLFTPYPTTEQYNKAVERGFKVPKNTLGWSKIHRITEDYQNQFPWLKENLSTNTLSRLEVELRK